MKMCDEIDILSVFLTSLFLRRFYMEEMSKLVRLAGFVKRVKQADSMHSISPLPGRPMTWIVSYSPDSNRGGPDSRAVKTRVGSMVVKAPLGQVFSEYFGFLAIIHSTDCSTVIIIY
jgi:hypothetical protein